MKFLERHKKFFIITISFLCIAFIIISILYKEKPSLVEDALVSVTSPVQKLSMTIGNYFADKINFYNNMNVIEDENYKLKQQVSDLIEENKRLSFMEEENKILTKLVDLDQRYPKYSKVGAYVIAKDNGNWYDIFNIDKGTDSGIERNMVVLTDGGLVGKIIKSGTKYSRVLSIIDDTSSVSVKSKRTGDRGVLRGDLNLMLEGLCFMENIDIEAEIVENDEIITSDLSKYFPPGITIGYVREIKVDAKGLTKTAIVEPLVDFKNIKTVLVIKEVFEKNIDDFDGSEEN